jgi:hypothetical protein
MKDVRGLVGSLSVVFVSSWLLPSCIPLLAMYMIPLLYSTNPSPYFYATHTRPLSTNGGAVLEGKICACKHFELCQEHF